MGGSSVGGLGLPSAPGAAPGFMDPTIQLARGSALRTLKTKRGLGSTFLTGGGSLDDTGQPAGAGGTSHDQATAAARAAGFASRTSALLNTGQKFSLPSGMSLADLHSAGGRTGALLGGPSGGGGTLLGGGLNASPNPAYSAGFGLKKKGKSPF